MNNIMAKNFYVEMMYNEKNPELTGNVYKVVDRSDGGDYIIDLDGTLTALPIFYFMIVDKP